MSLILLNSTDHEKYYPISLGVPTGPSPLLSLDNRGDPTSSFTFLTNVFHPSCRKTYFLVSLSDTVTVGSGRPFLDPCLLGLEWDEGGRLENEPRGS